MMINLHPITAENWRACVKLKLADGQEKFVASNAGSLAQAAYSGDEWYPRGIYEDDELVGFLMLGIFDEEDEASGESKKIWGFARLMIDMDHQGKGYGRAAIKAALDFMRSEPDHPIDVYISYVPENTVAAHLYASLGFKPAGKTDDGSEDKMHLVLEK